MAKIEEHCEDCRKLLGKAWSQVHDQLDLYGRVFHPAHFAEYHRTFFHNRYGIELVRAKWGDQAALAAEIHIVRDYMEMPLTGKDLSWVRAKLGKALMYFNNNDNFDPRLDPRIIESWNNKSLVLISKGE